MRRGEAPQVQALTCGPHNFKVVLQKANMKEVSRTLNHVCDVVAQVESRLDILCFFIINFFTAINLKHFKIMDHVSSRHQPLNATCLMMVLRIWLLVEEMDNCSQN